MTIEDISSREIAGHPYEPEIDDFLACIQENKPTLVDAFEGGTSAAAMIMAAEAIETDQVLQVPRFQR